MSDKCHLLGKFMALYFVLMDMKDMSSKLVLNRVIKQTDISCKGLAAIPQNSIYQGAGDPGKRTAHLKEESNTRLLWVLSWGCQLLTVHMHQNPPPDSLPTSISCPTERRQAPGQGPLCFCHSSFSSTAALLCLMPTVLS